MITTTTMQGGRPRAARWGQPLEDPAMDELVDRLAAGRDEDTQLELAGRLWFGYRGHWRADQAYEHGDLVNYSGVLWAATAPTDGPPGEGPGWRRAAECLSVVEPAEEESP